MKITKKWLLQHKACCSKEDMDRAEKELKGDITLICDALLKEDRFDDANWLIVKFMNKKQGVQYAIFAAKQVLNIFEKEYPQDKNPRLAIESAEIYLKNPCEKTRDAAIRAANAVLYTAANEVADAAFYAAAYAVHAAAYAASAAANAAYAAGAADKVVDVVADAAFYAVRAAANATRATMKDKIIKNGLKILKGGK